MYRAALRDGEAPEGKNPFDRFRLIKKSRPDRPKLTAEQVRALEEVDLGGRGPGAPPAARSRDYFLFSFYSAGVRFTDVALMRRSNVRVVKEDGPDGERRRGLVVSYVMGKTKKRQTVRADPKALPVVEAYLGRKAGGDDPLLFPMLDQGKYDLSDPEDLVAMDGMASGRMNASEVKRRPRWLARVPLLTYTKRRKVQVPLPPPMPNKAGRPLSRMNQRLTQNPWWALLDANRVRVVSRAGPRNVP